MSKTFSNKFWLVLGLALILGHVYYPYGDSFSYYVLSILLTFLLLVSYAKINFWGCLLIVYIVSHFYFAGGIGFMINTSFFLFSLFTKLTRNKGINKAERLLNGQPKDQIVEFLLAVFVIFNVFGWLGTSDSLKGLVFSVTTLFSFILLFQYVRKLKLSVQHVSDFIKLSGYLSIVLLLIALNQKFGLIQLRSPLTGNYLSMKYPWGNMILSSFYNSETYGEYSALMLIIYFSLFLNESVKKKMGISNIFAMFVIFVNIGNVFLSWSRSALIISVFGFGLILLTNLKSSSLMKIPFKLAVVVVILMVAFFYAGSIFNAPKLINRFDEYKDMPITLQGVITGEAINRSARISFGLKRLGEEPFIVGSGFRMGDKRAEILSGQKVFDSRNANEIMNLGSFHSLYLQLPILYGWAGAIAFLSLILVAFYRLYKFKKKSYTDDISKWLMNTLLVFWIILLMNEYKIDIIRFDNYHLLFWFWLGFTYAAINMARHSLLSSRKIALGQLASINK